MANPSVQLVAALALLLFMSHAAVAHRTTITTVEYEEERRPSIGRIQSCREEIEKQDLSHCQHYLETRGGHSSGSTKGDVMDMHHLIQSCCHQLQRMDEGCRCQEIRQIVREQQREYAGEEMEEMVRAARDLTSVCGVAPQRCEFRAVWF